MKNHENHLQVINSTLILLSQMSLHSFIVCFLIFASGLFIGMTINFSLRNTPVHPQISQFSLGLSDPHPTCSSHIIVNEREIVAKNDPNESTEVSQPVNMEPNIIELLQTMDIVPNGKERPQTVDSEPNAPELPQTVVSEPNAVEMPQTVSIEPNGTELPQTVDKDLNVADVPQTVNNEPNVAELPQTVDAESNGTEVPQPVDTEPNVTEVPQTMDTEPATDLPQTVESEPNAPELPQTVDTEPNAPQTVDTEPNAPELPQTVETEPNGAEVPQTVETEPNVAEVPQTVDTESNGTELPQTVDIEPNNGTELPQTVETEPNVTEVPQTVSTEPNGTELPSTVSTEPNATELPQPVDTEPNATPQTVDTEPNATPQTVDTEPNATELPQTVDTEPNATELPQPVDTEPNATPQTVDTEPNATELPQTVNTEPNGTEMPQTMQVEPNGTENNTEIAVNQDPNLVEDTNDANTDHQLISRGIAYMHNLSDDSLISRALTVDHENDETQFTPKVAFMFLSKGNLHLAPLWDMFFKGHEGFYSVYVHTQPTFNGTFPIDSAFHGRRIPSKKVEWGKFNMIEAEKRLLANALLDVSNQRFVLLSESCIPLFNFSTVYSYLLSSTQNFVEAYDMPGPVGRGRYNDRMKPDVTLEQWRKGSQWFQMNRELAVEVISDHKYMELFRSFCKPACYSDEHYIPTFVSMYFWEKNSNRTLTWVDWAMGGPHPTRFGKYEVTPALLRGMRKSDKKCLYNGNEETNVCFMFARKFLPNAVEKLLRIAPKIMNF